MYNDYWYQNPVSDLMENFLIKTDSYKVTHFPQYPPGTTKVVSYLESRGCSPKWPDGTDMYSYTVWFGLQYNLLRHFCGQQVTHDKIDQAKEFFNQHLGVGVFNEKGWRYIADVYDGRLPIKIKSVPEGTKVPLKNVLFVIENDDQNILWLNEFISNHWTTNYAETPLSNVWYPTTVATNSAHARDIIKKFQEETCDTVDVDYSLHDFGLRGGSSYETSCIGGMSHLISFDGTDNMPAIALANKAYNSKVKWNAVHELRVEDVFMYGHSVVATEHSTMTPWGLTPEQEKQCVLNLLHKYPTGILSVVGDSKNIFRFTEMLHEDKEIKDLILSRDGKFVLRPDSGDPIEVDCALLEQLWDGFGGEINKKGYKVLNPKVGLLQGDGIDLLMLYNILIAVKELRFATNNPIFGSGGGLIQKFDRDTLKFAIKCSFAIIDGKDVDVQKDPITSSGKKSKKGRLALIKDEDGKFTTLEGVDTDNYLSIGDLLEPVYDTGVLVKFQTFDEIRKLAR